VIFVIVTIAISNIYAFLVTIEVVMDAVIADSTYFLTVKTTILYIVVRHCIILPGK
jgi:hypothetical protein